MNDIDDDQLEDEAAAELVEERPREEPKPVIGSWGSKVWSVKGISQEERDFISKSAAAAEQTIGAWIVAAAHWRVSHERMEALKRFGHGGVVGEVVDHDETGARAAPPGAPKLSEEALLKLLEVLIPLSNTKGCRATAARVRKVVELGMAQWYPTPSRSKRLAPPDPRSVPPPRPAEAAIIAEMVPRPMLLSRQNRDREGGPMVDGHGKHRFVDGGGRR